MPVSERENKGEEIDFQKAPRKNRAFNSVRLYRNLLNIYV